MKIIEKALAPFSWVYGFVIMVRNRFYDLGYLRTVRIGVPVISVGNITVGGTGKTPLVALIASRLTSEGKRVAIVSRGYRRKSRGPVIISDGKTILADAVRGGDEPVELAKIVPSAIVGVDASRRRISRLIVEQWKPDVVIMDDGFQHRMLHRDCDCVVIDGHALPDATGLLPAGLRREPLRSLRRATLIVISRWHEGIDGRTIRQKLQRYTDAPVVFCRYAPTAVVDRTNNATLALEWIRGRKCVAFCGIGSPESFRHTLGEIGVSVGSVLNFADHHFYSENDVAAIVELAHRHSAEMVLTTGKDAARFGETQLRRFGQDTPLMTIELAVHFVEGEELFWSMLRKAVQ